MDLILRFVEDIGEGGVKKPEKSVHVLYGWPLTKIINQRLQNSDFQNTENQGNFFPRAV